ALDDAAVGLLPPVVRDLAKIAVDNPLVDGWQRNLIAKPIAEIVYQLYTSADSLLAGASEFAQRVIVPGRALIAELSTNAGAGESKHLALRSQVKALLLGTAGLLEALPLGLGQWMKLLISSGVVNDAVDWLAGFISEILYQGWKFLTTLGGVDAGVKQLELNAAG
ncbi:MAG: hypothetical protein ACRC2U_09740, partial [Aeromonas sp.]